MGFVGTHPNIRDQDDRDRIADTLRGQTAAEITDVTQKRWKDQPPAPLSLPWAQRKFPGTPSQVLDNLQYLYNAGYTTYPRTESQRYGDDFAFGEKILALGTASPFDVPEFGGDFDPSVGGGRDSAHPPITPTTNIPHLNDLGKWQKKTYIRVVKHFLATLMDPAVKQKRTYTLEVDGLEFETEVLSMVEMGYFDQYGAYKRVYDDEDPDVEEGDIVSITSFALEENQTDPPELWSQSDMIEKMENVGIGTSATRGSMIDKVISRDYIDSDDGLHTQRLGEEIVNTLQEYAPRLTDPEWTSELQTDLEQIKDGDLSASEVESRAREWVADVCVQMKKSEQEIGRGIVHLEEECPECGGDLWLRDGQYGMFYGCENYPDCEHTE